LDDEKKLGWRAIEMGVLIPVGRSIWSGGYLVVSILVSLSPVSVSGEISVLW
jgi:hypothetical protein